MIFIIVFWCCLFILCSLSLVFVLPALAGKLFKAVLASIFLITVISLYFTWGAPKVVTTYYTQDAHQLRLAQDKMRPLFSQLKKQQGRLRLRLQENTDDAVAKALLLELLGVEALYQEDRTLALKFWQGALQLLPENQETDFIRDRIQGLIKHTEHQ